MLKTFCHLHDEEGIFRFYVGGTLGVDMWAAEQLLYLKEQPGYQDIELIVALPFEGHDSKWDAMSKQRLQIIIHNATKCIVIGQSGTTSDYKKRNYYMVDHADFLIAYVCHAASNAENLLTYAKKRERKGLIRITNLGENSFIK